MNEILDAIMFATKHGTTAIVTMDCRNKFEFKKFHPNLLIDTVGGKLICMGRLPHWE